MTANGTCPACGSPTEPGQLFCRNCGTKLNTAANETCPACGSPTEPGQLFCRNCGARLNAAPAPAEAPVAAQAEPVAQASGAGAPQPSAPQPETAATQEPSAPAQVSAAQALPVCAVCGTPATLPDQRFCRNCGAAIGAAPSAAQPGSTAQPVPASSAVTPAAPVAPSKSAEERYEEAKNKFNAFIGDDVDLDAVGTTFNANSVTLATEADAAKLSDAFAYFGKAFSRGNFTFDEPEKTHLMSDDRIKKEAQAEYRAAVTGPSHMARRDYEAMRAQSGFNVTGNMGAFASGLKIDESIVPCVAAVDVRTEEKAKQAEAKARLKSKVDLGEMSQNDAVEAYEANSTRE
jgi:uncharacterized Zn finger protein (UPF0148 family)